jgi:hypothetical protein
MNIANSFRVSAASLIAASAFACGSAQTDAGETKVPVTFSGGHEIGRNDYGRPVVLIAAGLGVKPDVFRQAFSSVTPARGRGPTREEAQRNKAALLKVLGPHGVTNDRLDEVSNYYRFRPGRGERWPTSEAKAHAIVDGGKIKRIVVTESGSGYCTPPTATVEGMETVPLVVNLHLDKDLTKNGGIESITVAPSNGKK